MTQWMQEDFKASKESLDSPSLNNRKRKAPANERQDVHKKIKSFFQQFKQSSQFDEIRKQLQYEATELQHAMDVDGFITTRLSSEAKLKFLFEYRQTVANIYNVINALGDPYKQLEAVACIAKFLFVVELIQLLLVRDGGFNFIFLHSILFPIVQF